MSIKTSANQKVLLTEAGKKELEQELSQLINTTRPAIIQEIKEAREQGDLSENADYEAARMRQAEVETRIKNLESILARVKIISDTSSQEQVRLGSTVDLKIINDSKKTNVPKQFTVQIVGIVEANPFENKISNESPLAKAILGHKVNDEVEVHVPKSTNYRVQIIEINKKQ